jgi:hypothetical protein
MSTATLSRWSGWALVGGGVSFAIFMALHPYDALAGSHGPDEGTWVPAHVFHLIGALLTLFGLTALYMRQRERSGLVGFVGFVLAFVGTAMFVGTGMITAFVWPVITDADPGFVDSDGPMFEDPLTQFAVQATYAFLIIGFLTLAFATYRAGMFARWAAVLLGVGIVLFGVPVDPIGPVPWFVRIVGGFVFGAALIALGARLSRDRGGAR